MRPTQGQINGGFLGALASIGIPLANELASKIFGEGFSVPKRAASTISTRGSGKGKGLNVSPKPNMLMSYYPPPFIGNWENLVAMGVKKNLQRKKKGQGLILGKNSPFNNISLLGMIL